MGDIITKNWKKIFIITGAIILAILLFHKITWKSNVVEDYVKSDITIERDVIDGIKNTTNTASNEIGNKIDESRGSRSVVGWIIIFAVVLFAILILDLFMQPSDNKKKK